ncbi:hypothetical protein AB0H73_34455 [Streptomyces olivoreticuli]
MKSDNTWCLTCARLTLTRAAAFRCGEYQEVRAADADLRRHQNDAHSGASVPIPLRPRC